MLRNRGVGMKRVYDVQEQSDRNLRKDGDDLRKDGDDLRRGGHSLRKNGHHLRKNGRNLGHDRFPKNNHSRRNDHDQTNRRGDRYQMNHHSRRKVAVWSDVEGMNENDGLSNVLDNEGGSNRIVDQDIHSDDHRVSYWKKRDIVQHWGQYDLNFC